MRSISRFKTSYGRREIQRVPPFALISRCPENGPSANVRAGNDFGSSVLSLVLKIISDVAVPLISLICPPCGAVVLKRLPRPDGRSECRHADAHPRLISLTRSLSHDSLSTRRQRFELLQAPPDDRARSALARLRLGAVVGSGRAGSLRFPLLTMSSPQQFLKIVG